MDARVTLTISEPVRKLMPALRAHTLVFDEARIGFGHRGLDTLRERVFGQARPALEAARDLNGLAELAAFSDLLRAGGIDPYKVLPVHGQLFRLIKRREPFPVENDAIDGAQLLSVFYRIPVFAFDESVCDPPYQFHFLQPGMVSGTFPGRAPDLETPVLSDRKGLLASLIDPRVRGGIRDSTKTFLLVFLDPGVGGGVDHGHLVRRAQNWLGTLTSGRLVAAAVCS